MLSTMAEKQKWDEDEWENFSKKVEERWETHSKEEATRWEKMDTGFVVQPSGQY
jgi:hypothetical protein